MLARVTYVLVGVAAITLILGFFFSESNILLFVSIGLSLAAIVLIIVGATRRAREAPADVGAEAFDEFEEEEEIPEDILSAFDEEDLEPEYEEEEEYEEEFEDLEPEFEEEELEEEEEEEEPARAAAKTKTRAKKAAKKKAAKKKAAKKKTPAKKSAAKRKASTVLAVEGRDRYHDPDCRFVRDKDPGDLEELTVTSAKRRGYEPCSVCSPD